MSSRQKIATAAGAAFALLAATLGSAAGAQPRPAARAAAATPRVTTMVVGRGNRVLLAARPAGLPAEHIPVPGAGRCALASATPLGALEAARRAGRLRYTLQRLTACAPSQLFVTSIDGERNAGVAGWVYKVDGRSGTAGAGDPSGPFGTGRRLHSGDSVLWFYCVNALRCQPTLVVRADTQTPAAGAALGVTVLADDDQGRATPVVGATVVLGSETATSGPGGRAVLGAPPAGSYELQATVAGDVPAFPVAVSVA